MKALTSALALAAAFLAGAACSAESTLEYGRLGTVTLYQPAGTPRELALFISGDGGWTSGVIEMARHLADNGALVAGVDINQFGKRLRNSGDSCIFTAGDLEEFAHFLENKYGFPKYVNPILVGYSSGATLAYTTLVQAPRGTFKGALSLGFCPDLPWDKPMCPGDGPGLQADRGPRKSQLFRPASGLTDPWIAMQGTIDQVCEASVTREFVARIPAARLIELPKVGHGFSVEGNYVPQYLDAFAKLAAVPPPPRAVVPADISDLPLTEVPAHAPEKDLLAIMLSGDGGWAGLDRDVAAELAAAGVPVVGWDSLRYFWKARAPDRAAQDLDRVIRHYTQAWHKPRVIVVGYSMGAEAMPFMVNRLPEESREKLALVALLAPGQQAFFEFHLQLWLGQVHGGLPVAPEMQRLSGGRVLCIYGKDEIDSLCAALPAGTADKARLPGGHHFDGNYRELGARILQAVPGDEVAAPGASTTTAINIVLELDEATVARAKTVNARLRSSFPQGFALDASHVPHITLLQRYVRTRDLDATYAAVRRALDTKPLAGIKLTAVGYSYSRFGDTGLASVVIKPAPELVKLQQLLIEALTPYEAGDGTSAAFVTAPEEAGISPATIEYVKVFAANYTGANFKPHITVGQGDEEIVGKMKQERFAPFTVTVAGAAIYQLGNLGTARRKLWMPRP